MFMGEVKGMAKMRNPRRDELDYLFNFSNRIFKYERGGWNLTFVRGQLEAFSMDDILVIEEDGRIVSGLYMKPYKVYICGAVLEGAEVGGVATDERYRGRGFASTILREAVRQMTARGCDISTLGGYRDRYARWGWEHGGTTRTYTITERSVRYAGDHSGIEMTMYEPPDPTLKRKIIKAYEGQAIHMVRPKVDHDLTYDVKKFVGMEVWAFESEEGGFAYMVALRSQDGGSLSVLEHGGDPEVLAPGLRKAFEEWDLKEIRVPSPGIYTEFTPFLEQMSMSWVLHPSRQLNILSLRGCLEKLLPVAERMAGAVLEDISKPYSVTLGVAETGERVTVLFDRGCEVTDEDGEENLVLGRCQMVRLLFGQERPSSALGLSGRKASYLDLVFPLPFHEWRTDTR